MQVAAGVLCDIAGRVLLQQRPPGKPLAGQWEFPGGKIRAGETPLEGLVRELDEELGIRVTRARHLMRYSHGPADASIHLCVWRVLSWEGELRNRESQVLEWVDPAGALEHGLLEADAPILEQLRRVSAD